MGVDSGGVGTGAGGDGGFDTPFVAREDVADSGDGGEGVVEEEGVY